MIVPGLALVALAATTAAAPAVMNRPDDGIVILRRESSASIERALEIALDRLLTDTVTTYRGNPPFVGNDEIPFTSPIVSSFTVRARIKMGGEIVQPPIDDLDDIVYFE